MWNQTCVAGVQIIDDQHGILHDALNELRLSLKHGESCEAVRQQLERVVQLVQLHMDSEEKLLEKHNFPRLAAFQAERKHLLSEIKARPMYCNIEHSHRQSGTVSELASFLGAWFIRHREEAGSDYGPWLREHGVH
jgi:hemerythrin-like metal-binding protein